MNNNHRVKNKPVENWGLSAALAEMSEAEVTRVLVTIAALQGDLLRLSPLFSSEEQIKAMTHTQHLLNVLNNKMNSILETRQPKSNSDRSQNLDTVVPTGIDTPVRRLLSKIQRDKRHLFWTDTDGADKDSGV